MTESTPEAIRRVAEDLGLSAGDLTGGDLEVTSPIDGEAIASVATTSPEQLDATISRSQDAFRVWRNVPAPRRGEIVRRLGQGLRQNKKALGELVTLEVGKIPSEGEGEVQEMIDVCDFAVGLSRQLYGSTMPSERPGHRLMEQWHPMGPVGIVTAFNFPVAVWSWNTALALVCGDPVIWKPSEKSPLTALACQAILDKVLEELEPELASGGAIGGLSSVVIGDGSIGNALVSDERIPVISATGSTRMGRAVGQVVAGRFGRSILELGGNNAMIVSPSAELDLAVRAAAFAAVGTAGQRCTSLRRLIVHRSRRDEVADRLESAYGSVLVGDPRAPGTLMGPLIDRQAFDQMQAALDVARASGAVVLGGERIFENGFEDLKDAFYVRPALVLIDEPLPITKRETFAPILYVIGYSDLAEAIEIQNDVPQGLSSSIFTTDMREAERFLSASGSDCGIANVNAGTSGAEIGGAFGGEKQTGGGRESGSDAWKAYMRRQTATINYSEDLPLAQGVSFDIG
ncbi:MAG: aldehyde dehydrogenase family protein [Acidimicrobiales bacterium]